MVHYLTSTLFPCLVMLTRTGMLFHGVASFGWNPTITSTKISHRVPIRSSQLEMVTFPMFETQERDGPRTTKRMMPTRPKPTSYQGLDGIHHLFTAEHHKALLEANQDKLIVLKIFAPWCAECKRIDPHLKKIKNNTTPAATSRSSSSSSSSVILWADLALGPDNKDHVHSLGIEGIPTIQFYVHGGLEDTFSCGSSSIPLLNEKMNHYMEKYINYNKNNDDDDDTTSATPQSLKMARREDAIAATQRLASVFEDRTPPEWLFR